MKRLSIFLMLLAAVGVGGGCSSDPDTPLGASFVPDSLIQSGPGQVFQDTILVGSTDTTFVVNSFYTSFVTVPNIMVFGRADNFETWMLVRVDFAAAGEEMLKTVTGAQLRLNVSDGSPTGPLGGLFYETLEPVVDGDTLTTLNLAANPIPDSTGVDVERSLGVSPRNYTLPDTLVQRWIRGETPHNGIAIVLDDATTNVAMTFDSKSSSENKPLLQVFFSDTTVFYPLIADGTFTKDLSTTANLRLSDGDARRIWVPVDLSDIDDEALVHDARVVLTVVPGSRTEGGGTVELYAPKDSVIGSSGILSGTPITAQEINPTKDTVEFPIRNVIESFLADPKSNHGFVARYLREGSWIRRIDFFSSAAADSVRPIMRFTFSTPPTFPPDG
jgi:hypothetical protein